jgi:hypothetical protein
LPSAWCTPTVCTLYQSPNSQRRSSQVDLDEGLPVEVVLDHVDLVQHVAGEVELARHAQPGEVGGDVAVPVEEQAVPLLQLLARQVEAGLLLERGRAQQLAAAVVGPAVQRAGDGAAGELARAPQHHRLAVAADVGNQVVAPAVVDQRPGALGAPVEHAVVARIGRHLLVADVAGAAGEEEFPFGFSHFRVEVPRKRQVGSRARERFLTREVRHVHPPGNEE